MFENLWSLYIVVTVCPDQRVCDFADVVVVDKSTCSILLLCFAELGFVLSHLIRIPVWMQLVPSWAMTIDHLSSFNTVTVDNRSVQIQIVIEFDLHPYFV